jgi:hypothetical protein
MNHKDHQDHEEPGKALVFFVSFVVHLTRSFVAHG